MVLLHYCVLGSLVTNALEGMEEYTIYTEAWTMTLRETYKAMKLNICFISFIHCKHPALILHQENTASLY